MNIKELRKKSAQDLKLELLHLMRDMFYLRMNIKVGKLKKTNLLKNVRRNIARIKLCLLGK